MKVLPFYASTVPGVAVAAATVGGVKFYCRGMRLRWLPGRRLRGGCRIGVVTAAPVARWLGGTCTPTGDDGLVYEQTAKCCQHFKFICSIYKRTPTDADKCMWRIPTYVRVDSVPECGCASVCACY